MSAKKSGSLAICTFWICWSFFGSASVLLTSATAAWTFWIAPACSGLSPWILRLMLSSYLSTLLARTFSSRATLYAMKPIPPRAINTVRITAGTRGRPRVSRKRAIGVSAKLSKSASASGLKTSLAANRKPMIARIRNVITTG